jgi:hypothetical protein
MDYLSDQRIPLDDRRAVADMALALANAMIDTHVQRHQGRANKPSTDAAYAAMVALEEDLRIMCRAVARCLTNG